MTSIFNFIVLIIFPASSWTFSCNYNDSTVILRKTVLLELEDHNYINIYDAKIDIRPNAETVKWTTLFNKNNFLIDDVSFKGYLVKGDESEYVEVTLNNLKSVRFDKHDRTCRLSYQETKSEGLNITVEQETAITRLAESCIQSIVCGIDLMEIDMDSDLYYQSTQSSLNELVDFYVPKLLKLLLDKDGIFKTPTANISDNDISFSVKSGMIKGIDTVQRANDVVIKYEKSKYNVSLLARFSELDISLNDMKAKYKLFATSGNLHAILQGISFKTNVIIDLQPSICKVTLDDMKMISFKDIKINIPLWGWFNISYHLDSKKLWFFEKSLLSYIIKSIPEYNVDCKQYLDKLSLFA